MAVNDWMNFLNEQAQGVVGYKVDQITTKPTPPVATNQGGVSYTEGKPATVMAGKGIPTMYLVGGAAALLLVAFLVLRK